ncbi:MAG TPA: catalase family peroxidase [Methylophaga aminisulfidivorans]|uniref:Catalase-related peroxidase n=2 Tax=root TaxID=1 RepID=A0A7C1VR78_9GAMM|nr:catalase family peroxidase [Methylophaga aminisulfidivorans]
MAAFMFAKFGSGNKITAQDFVDLQQGKLVYEGFRRAHAKGFCIGGVLQSNGNLAQYTSAYFFSRKNTPFTGRISIAGNNPTAPDLKAPVRSLALSLSSKNEVWRTAMNTPPVMAVRNPYDFYQQLLALAPDPTTNERDPSKIRDFFDEHPESKAFRTWASEYSPKNSFAEETYHSINAFYLINNKGNKQAVRWRVSPPIDALAAADLDTSNNDALQDEFFNRLKAGNVKFDLIFTFATAEDNVTDPTQAWPSSRREVIAGQLLITDATPQKNSICNEINFDPLVLPTGIEASQDKILGARSSAYAESYRRRAKEHLLRLSE